MKHLNSRLVEELNKLKTKEETLAAYEILKSRYNQLQEWTASQFYIGQEVFFIKKDGARIDGKVERINRKTISVDTGSDGGWRVAPDKLTPNTGD